MEKAQHLKAVAVTLDDLSPRPGIQVTEGETQPLQLSPSSIHVPSQHTLDKAATMPTLYMLLPGNCSAFHGKWNSGQGLEQLYLVTSGWQVLCAMFRVAGDYSEQCSGNWGIVTKGDLGRLSARH